MVVMNFAGVSFGKMPAVKRCQFGSISIAASATSNTATITSVTTANSLLLYGGITPAVDAGEWKDIRVRLTLTNATTITAERTGNVAAIDISYFIIEFYPGIVKSNQSGTIAITGTSNTDTITSVDTSKSICVYLGELVTTASTAIQYINSTLTRVTLTNATTVTGTRDGSDNAATAGYQVVEFY